MILALVQLLALASASRTGMMGHHHHHHHHHHANADAGIDMSGSDDGKMDPEQLMNKMKNMNFGKMMSGIKANEDDDKDPTKPIDTKVLPDQLKGLAAAANSGDENSIMASIQSLTGMGAGDLKSDAQLHIQKENGADVYDLRGAFKVQTLPPMTLPTMPPPPDLSKSGLKKFMAEHSTTTTTTTTTTSTTTTTTTTTKAITTTAKSISPAQANVQLVAPQPYSQPAGQPPASQAGMPFMPQQQQAQPFQQFPPLPVQQFQQFPQQNAFLPPQVQQMQPQMQPSQVAGANAFQALENGLGQMMQTVSAMNNEAAGAGRAEMDAQRALGAEQVDHNVLEQLTQRVAALEAGHVVAFYDRAITKTNIALSNCAFSVFYNVPVKLDFEFGAAGLRDSTGLQL